MRWLITSLLFLTSLAANAATEKQLKFYSEKDNYAESAHIMAEAYGDLDKDKLPEKVVVVDSGVTGLSDMGSGRDILIYKMNQDETWYLWHASRGAVLDDNSGGMMGDAFESISIERGAIVITHFGGSRFKWNLIHRYRFQDNNWYVIGATVYHGALCDKYMSFDYNLVTGKAVYHEDLEWDEESCGVKPSENIVSIEETLSLPTGSLPLMDGFYPGSNAVELPKNYDKTVYY